MVRDIFWDVLPGKIFWGETVVAFREGCRDLLREELLFSFF